MCEEKRLRVAFLSMQSDQILPFSIDHLLHVIVANLDGDKLRYWSVCAGPGCSKLTMSLVNVSLKFQTLISQICPYFLLKKCEKLLQCKSFSHFVNKKISVFLVIKW